MHFEIEDMYKLARQGTIPKQYVEHILAHDFDDYNNDYRNEIRFILKTILKKDKYPIQSSDIPRFVKLIDFHDKTLFKEFFDNLSRKMVIISEDNFKLILDQKVSNPNINIKYRETIEQSRDNFINYALKQEGFHLEDLTLLKIFTQHPSVSEKILSSEELKIFQPIYDYLKEHYKYKDIIQNKNIEVLPSSDTSLSYLAKELVLTENYMHDFLKTEVQYDKTYLNNFFSKTYSMIFDKNNTNRDKFSVDFVKKQVQISVDSMNYLPSFTQKTIEDMRKNYSATHPFSKLKK